MVCTCLQNVAAVVNAIQNSPLQLTPASEGSEVLVKLPRMTTETIDRMVKLVHMESEGAHQSVRRARQKAMDAVKKEFKDGSKDERKRMEKEVRCFDVYLCRLREEGRYRQTMEKEVGFFAVAYFKACLYVANREHVREVDVPFCVVIWVRSVSGVMAADTLRALHSTPPSMCRCRSYMMLTVRRWSG